MVSLLSHVVGGVAIFLYGMRLATDGLREAAGGRLRATLTVLTARRVTALLSGVVVTFFLSSSSAVAVMLVDLADAGLLSLVQAVFILLGAGVGVSLTVHIITFPVATWALFVVAAGLIIHVAARFRRGRALGTALIGAAFVFYGLDLVNSGVASRAADAVRLLSPWLTWRVVGFLVGVLVSSLLRSVATAGLAVVLAGNGVALDGLVPVVLGATVGTCSAPLLASLRSGRAGREVALAELLFRSAAAAALLFCASPLARAAEWTTGLVTSGEDAARRNVANVMLLASLATVVAVAPISAALSGLVKRLRRRAEAAPGEPVRSDAEQSLSQTHRDAVRMAESSRALVSRAVRSALANDERELERIEAADASIDAMDHVLTRRLEAMKPADLGPEGLEVKLKLLYIVKEMEEMADLATRELTHIGWEKSRDNVVFDAAQTREIEQALSLVDDGLGRMLVAVKGEDRTETARQAVFERDREIDRLRLKLFEAQSMRVAADEPNAEVSSESYMNIVNVLRAVHSLVVDVVRTLSEPPPREREIRDSYGHPRTS